MIRYTPYKEKDINGADKTPFEMYQEAVDRTHEPKKSTLKKVEAVLSSHYGEYGNQYTTENVHSISSHCITEPEASMLRSLYFSNSSIIKRVKTYFNNEFPNRIYRNTCPYCGLPGAGTTEHILPKDDYPEYAIHILNLLPCCNVCNSCKKEKVKDALGNPEFINFYYHDIDSSEFLKADLSFDAKRNPQFTFRLEFCTGFDPILLHAIENHYENLHLLTRYSSLADSKYTEFELAIITFALGRTDIINVLSDYKDRVEILYGKNHYYSAMIRAMVTSSDYHNYIQPKI